MQTLYKFAYPTMRYGIACEVVNNADEKKILFLKDSREIAEKVKVEFSNSIVQLHKLLLDEYDVDLGTELSSTGIKKNEGFVVDFNALTGKCSNYCFQLKISVTVCSGENRSKIWCRLTLLKYKDEHGHNDKSAYDLNQELIDSFYEKAEKYIEIITDKLTQDYLSLVRENVGHDYCKDRKYKIFIFATGSNDSKTKEVIEKIKYERYSMTKVQEEYSEFYKKVFQPNLSYRAIGYPPSKDQYKKLVDNKKLSWIQSEYKGNLSAFCCVHRNEDSTYFAGITFMDEDKNSSEYIKEQSVNHIATVGSSKTILTSISPLI